MNKKTNFYLTLFLGWAGYYRFYKDQIVLGFVYLLTFGLFGLGWIYDIFASYKEIPFSKVEYAGTKTTVVKSKDIEVVRQKNLEKARAVRAEKLQSQKSEELKKEEERKKKLAKEKEDHEYFLSTLSQLNEYLKTDEFEDFLMKNYKTVENFAKSLDSSFFVAIADEDFVWKPINYIDQVNTEEFELTHSLPVDKYAIVDNQSTYQKLRLAYLVLCDCLFENNSLDRTVKYNQMLIVTTIKVDLEKYLFNRASKFFDFTNPSDWLNEYINNEIINHSDPKCLSMLTDYIQYNFDAEDRDGLSWEVRYEAIKLKVKQAMESKYKENVKKRLLGENNETDHHYKIEEIDEMTGEQFERFIGELFEKLGYKIIVTKISGDQGIDVIVEKKGIKTGIQCKRYTNKVSNSAIQEAVAGKAQYKLDKVMVITTNYFTKSAIELANSNQVTLWNREKLISTLELINEI